MQRQLKQLLILAFTALPNSHAEHLQQLVSAQRLHNAVVSIPAPAPAYALPSVIMQIPSAVLNHADETCMLAGIVR